MYRGFNNNNMLHLACYGALEIVGVIIIINKYVHKNLMHEITNQKECRLLEVKCTASRE